MNMDIFAHLFSLFSLQELKDMFDVKAPTPEELRQNAHVFQAAITADPPVSGLSTFMKSVGYQTLSEYELSTPGTSAPGSTSAASPSAVSPSAASPSAASPQALLEEKGQPGSSRQSPVAGPSTLDSSVDSGTTVIDVSSTETTVQEHSPSPSSSVTSTTTATTTVPTTTTTATTTVPTTTTAATVVEPIAGPSGYKPSSRTTKSCKYFVN